MNSEASKKRFPFKSAIHSVIEHYLRDEAKDYAGTPTDRRIGHIFLDLVILSNYWYELEQSPEDILEELGYE